MRFKREISNKILSVAQHFPAVVITGSRQTGKTTLLRALFPDHSYVSLDLPADAQLAEEDPETFLTRYPAPVVIDEVQYAPKLFRHLKVRIDRERKLYGHYILTGSQKFTLMKEVSDSLAGRCVLLDMEPLSVAELGDDLRLKKATKGIGYILARGHYPQLWDEPEMPRTDFYRSYLGTYIERDVRQILNIGSIRDFDRFMRVCAVRTGQMVNKSEIAKEVGVSAKTANDWLSILDASNQIVLLEPYFENIGKRVVKSPKLFFTDTGLATFLMGLNEETILSSPLLGNIWETFIFAELRKTLTLHKPEASLWFYRDQQREADFLISYGSKIYLLDAKWKEVPTSRDFMKINAIQGFFKYAHDKTYLVSTSDNSFPVSSKEGVVSGMRLAEFIEETM